MAGDIFKTRACAVASVSLFGRLPEICLSLSNGLHVLSMMTAEGDPGWELTNHAEGKSISIFVRAGILHLDGGGQRGGRTIGLGPNSRQTTRNSVNERVGLYATIDN